MDKKTPEPLTYMSPINTCKVTKEKYVIIQLPDNTKVEIPAKKYFTQLLNHLKNTRQGWCFTSFGAFSIEDCKEALKHI